MLEYVFFCFVIFLVSVCKYSFIYSAYIVDFIETIGS